MLGQTLGGRYQILKQLRKGGFGFTFLAEDTQRPGNPKCVVKQLQPIVTESNTLREAQRLFQKEAEIQETLGNHDQIPRLLAHFEENREFYLVQEFIAGHDLSQELPLGKQMSEAYVRKLLQEILEVLAFVHQHGVIHRDIKPSNIRRRTDGKIVLIDFGAVKQMGSQVPNLQVPSQSAFTIAIGTPGYLPSEQANGQPQFSSDVYAVGMIGLQALTGVYPVQLPKDFHTHEIIWRHLVNVSQELADILDTMVRYDFRQRYHSADEALQALVELPSGTLKAPDKVTPITTSSPPPPTTTPIQSSSPPRKLLIELSIGAAILTGVILLTQVFFNPRQSFVGYENPSYGIKIKYPQDWEIQNINNPITGEVVAFISPGRSNANKPQEKLTISVEDFSGTLNEFSNSSIQDIKKHMLDAKILNAGSTTLARKSANQLVFIGKDNRTKLKNLQVFTLKSDKAYVITYTAEINNYEKSFHTVDDMIKSFEIEPN
ncbi:protein kinase [Aetokthonos hydrillicola Thurmond2011]|uniref:non-specific serine/threonine protein kinase n=1 Tax=Aetokthonos hydrillicola Thurmond2011 TaxID=2712845 RepID=A0AAP5I7I5_9CYAN|nr:serine/threonine protein kinase [Aetokthonos hydrillicola CCALA 1050]MBW4585561.1 protein kinase [Aetokthonos hydrillicola CCALA 1050]MDR9896185.1 protein kinase [Aetokthonos hydrillicola Thurmond2011]